MEFEQTLNRRHPRSATAAAAFSRWTAAPLLSAPHPDVLMPMLLLTAYRAIDKQHSTELAPRPLIRLPMTTLSRLFLLALVALLVADVVVAQDYSACMVLQGLKNPSISGFSSSCSSYSSTASTQACTGVQPAVFTCDSNTKIIAFTVPPVTSAISGATLATDIGSLTSLTSLTLSQNSLGGTVPTQIGQLSVLAHLDLSLNKLSSTLPAQIGYLSSLTYLFLDSNSFGGPIPTQLGYLNNLVELDLGVNKFTSTIPSQLGLLTNLVNALNLDMNLLQGTVPAQIYSLTKLQRLELFGNQLNVIGTQIGQMTALTVLELEVNSFGGAIPSTLGLLTNLVELGLHGNLFTGTVPQSVCSLTNLVELTLCDSYTGNAGCSSLTTVPSCVYYAPASSLSKLNRTLSTLGSLPSSAVSSTPQDYSACMILQGLKNPSISGLSPPCSNYFNDVTTRACTSVTPAVFTCDATNTNIIAITVPPVTSAISGATLATDIGSLTSLTSLTLSQNSLGGTVPTQIGQLSVLVLSRS